MGCKLIASTGNTKDFNINELAIECGYVINFDNFHHCYIWFGFCSRSGSCDFIKIFVYDRRGHIWLKETDSNVSFHLLYSPVQQLQQQQAVKLSL